VVLVAPSKQRDSDRPEPRQHRTDSDQATSRSTISLAKAALREQALRKPIENRSSDRSKAAGLIHLTDWIRSSCEPLTAAFEKRQMASCVDNCFPNSPCGKQVVIPLNDWNIIDTPKAMSTKFHEEMTSLFQAFSLFHGLRRRGKSGKI
jgi:hypothetical protein